MSLQQKIYPGELATPRDVVALADEYVRAADCLLTMGRRRAPVSRAPHRLVAIHAIELYLNAALGASGMTAPEVRGLKHDLAQRAALARQKGLILTRGSMEDLKGLSERREYIAMRYEPDLPSEICQPSRIAATLKEVAKKVTAFVELLDRPN